MVHTEWVGFLLGLCSHINFSPLWRPREGKSDVAILISPHHGYLEKAWVM